MKIYGLICYGKVNVMKKEKFETPDYYDFRKPETIHKKEKVKKDCMMCYKPFMSEGNHNRICYDCKRTDDWHYGNDYGMVK